MQRKSQYRVNIEMKSRDLKFSANVEAYVLPSIIPAQPSQYINTSTWNIPDTIQLTDPHFYQQEKIDLLLGAEFYYKVVQSGTIHLANNLPTLQNTVLGWVVGGAIKKNPVSKSVSSSTCAVFDDTSLEEAIERLWKLDEIEVSEKCMSPSEKQCESHFNQHTYTYVDGRFIVSFPFRENPTALGESHAMAYNRFLGLERRLLHKEDIRTQYIKFMQEYEQLGHMEKVDINNISDPKYFIPHHCVLKPDSTTTKLRVVFDASAKTSSGHSLNDLMYTGPTVQSELFSILLRFRLPKFVFTTDIEKMYRQILINPDDRRYQLIIWREDPSLPISYYKLNTVTYGTRAAPYLATKCLQKIADENIINYPYGAQMLKHNFYVDDGLGGSDSLNIALEIQKELIIILRSHGFNLKKWCANHLLLLKNIPLGNQEVDLNFDNNNINTIKTLGLLWLPKTDHLCVKVKSNHPQTITKRTVTSDLAKLFDPLGLLAPVVVKAKMFIQQLWQFKLDWDEPLPKDLHEIWSQFRYDLDHLNNFEIPRHIFKGEIPVKTQLHAFSDASEKAYGAAAYIRATLKDGRILVQLLCAKTRVAPLKQQTLPRLELCAAVLAAQLVDRIKTDLQIKNQAVFLWTDSEIVLSWINSQSSIYHTFVANRISKIQSITLPEQWRHVGSKDNPADIVSRGLSATRLFDCNLWFYGPLFLHGREEMWPPIFSQRLTPNDIEKKKTTIISAVTYSNDEFIYNIPHKNSFRTLQKIVGYILRFIRNTRTKKEDRSKYKALTPIELDNALNVIIRTIQRSEFSPEINQLRENKQVNKKSSIVSLSPFLDDADILRVGGRLEASLLSYDTKHPMLIPYNDPLTKLLFTAVHQENNHCGSQALLNTIRQRFWPVKGKIMARSIVQKCIRCIRARPQLCQQIMGNLPHTRVTPARPFINAGVDYCGPFWIHYKIRGKRPTKAYIAVFCCFSTKAVHLELVSDLSTDAFIGALKRFVGRRGRCQNIYCDNATNFVGAKNQLAELVDSIYSCKAQEANISASSSKGIHFNFIPPRAPHFGGLWEAAVKSAKHLLVRSVANASLTQEELETIIVEIEAILNSRPITPMTNDPNNLEALTPGHFLIGEALTSQVDSRAKLPKTSVSSHWKLVSHLKQEFWKRWSTEYLNELQQRSKWQKQFVNLKVGDMVIIKEDNIPIMKWPLGRVEKIHQGEDGIVRVADIKTANGNYKRPITRLALLPIITENSDKTIEQHQPINQTSDKPEVPMKRMRTSLNLLTVVMCFMLLPLVLGTNIRNKPFRAQLGIYYEGIGTTLVTPTEWQLLVYYDLEAFWSELELLSNGTRALNHLCQEMQQKATCVNLVNYFKHTESRLIMDSTLLFGKRQKRAAMDIVGNIAHSLFGVLDSEYAENMAHTITQVKQNEDHLLSLLKNQTSIIDSTINIIKLDQEAVKKKFDQIDFQISQIYNRIRNNSEEERIYHIFSSLCIQLTIMAANLDQTQSLLLDILTNTHHGIISPLLLTPIQLQREVDKILFHLPESLQLPVKREDALQLYKLMKVTGGLTNTTATFSITLPLIEKDWYDLFNLIPIPRWINNTLVSMETCSSLLAINIMQNKYFLMTNAELDSCTAIKGEMYLCSKGQIRYELDAAACACEINLFFNKTQSDCNVQKLTTTSTWISLRHQNQWIYALPSPSQATVVCKRDIIQLILEGSGLIDLGPECVLQYNSTTIQAHHKISSLVNTSYSKFWEITDAIHTKTIEPLLIEIHKSKYVSQIQNLTALQTSLTEQKILQLPNQIDAHNYHHITVGYSALLITYGIVVYLITKRKLKIAPTPAPRNLQTSSDFTVHI